MVSLENRLEPFWLVSVSARTVYDRKRTYAVVIGGPEVQTVTLLDQELTPQPASGKDGPRLALEAVDTAWRPPKPPAPSTRERRAQRYGQIPVFCQDLDRGY
jgi:hypothetical protein